MGRIADLCGEVAASADEGEDGLVLPAEAWDRLRADWSEEDIEDALAFVRDSLLQGELVEAADTLNARLLEVLGRFGDPAAYARARSGQAALDLDTLSHIARRVARLEEILEVFRDPIFYGKIPPLAHISVALTVAALALTVGALTFRKSSDRIPYYL
jgi:hypothetical protein